MDNNTSNSTLDVTETEFCFNSEIVYIFGFLVGLIFCFILCCVEPHKGCCCCCCCCRKCCGMLVAVHFLENKEDRIMVVAAFILLTNSIIDDLIGNTIIPTPSVLLKMVIKIVSVAFLYIRCFPLLVTIGMVSVRSQVLGIFYTIIYSCLAILSHMALCEQVLEEEPVDLEESHIEKKLFFIISIVSMIIHVPVSIYLIISYIIRIIHIKKGREVERNHLWDKHQIEYVKLLLMPPERQIQSPNPTKIQIVKNFFKLYFSKIPGFRFSLLILISISVGFVSILIVFVNGASFIMVFYLEYRRLIISNKDELNLEIPNVVTFAAVSMFKKNESQIPGREITLFDFLIDQMDVVAWCLILSFVASFLLACCSFVLMFISYKKVKVNMRKQVFKYTAVNFKKMRPERLMVSAIQYGGYQIAYIVWGFLLQFCVLFVLFLMIGEIVILPMIYEKWDFFLIIVESLLPYLTMYLVSYFMQRLLVKKCFLQDDGLVLAIKNRKGFYNMMYFMFFYNILMGFVACLRRMAKSIIFGLWFFPRLDRSIFPRTFEILDSGFVSYLCLLRLEDIQSNNILRIFVYLLINRRIFVSYYDNKCSSSNECLFASELKTYRKSKVARNRWFLAWTLLHNPRLSEYRKNIQHFDIDQANILPFNSDFDFQDKNLFVISKAYKPKEFNLTF